MIRRHQNPSVPGLTRDEPHPETARDPRDTAAATTRSGSVAPRPPHHQIARRAYEIYVSSGCVQGRCDTNWIQAEHELALEHDVAIDEPRNELPGARGESPLQGARSTRAGTRPPL